MNRKASSEYLAPFFTILAFFLLIHGLSFAVTNGFDDGTAPRVGTKQEHIYRGEQQREALVEYARIAADQALRRVESSGDPTEDYLERATAEFHAILSAHSLITAPAFIAQQEDGRVTFVSQEELSIPIVSAEERAALGGGTGPFTTWPVDGEMRITSLFGKRRTNVGGSRNHAGIDIGVPGSRYGAAVRAVQTGTATPYPWGVNLETVSGWTCEYLHVQSSLRGDQPVEVTEGEIIAEVVNDGYAPHVDLRCHNPQLLTANTASILLGDSHVGDANTAPADTTHGVTKGLKAYLDPYCLFAEPLRTRIDVPDDLTGFAERSGTTKQEKLQGTCNAYSAKRLFATQTSTSDVTIEPYHRTLERLNAQEYRGEPLMRLVTTVAAEEGMDPNLLIAMIAAESQGVVDASSGYAFGLMQLRCDTAQGMDPGVRCEDRSGGDLFDPAINLRLGATYWNDQLARWDDYTHRTAFAAAEYNGGHVLKGLAGEAPGPAYEDTMRALTPDSLRAQAPSFYGRFSDEALFEKIDEMTNHGRKVAAYYELGGGSTPPLTTSSAMIGTLDFHLSVAARQDTQLLALLDEVKRALNRCTQDCASVLESPALKPRLDDRFETVAACTAYSDEVLSRVAQCAQNLQDGCACEIPLPSQGQVLFEPDQLVADDRSPYLDWFGQADEDFKPVRYFLDYTLNETLIATPEGLSLAGRSARGIADEPTISVPASGAFWVRKHIAETGDWYVLDIQTAPPNSSALCEQRVVRSYCLDGIRLTIDHGGDPARHSGVVAASSPER